MQWKKGHRCNVQARGAKSYMAKTYEVQLLNENQPGTWIQIGDWYTGLL